MSSHLSKTDTHLYSLPRPPKNKPITTSSTSTLAFSSTLSSLLTPTSSTTPTTRGRPRPSAHKPDIFSAHNRNTAQRALRDLADADGRPRSKVPRHDIGDVDDAVLARSRRGLEEKARRYRELRRGEAMAGEEEAGGLIEWDRKWAEEEEEGQQGAGEESESEIDDLAGEGAAEAVEYEDEYGRLRRGTVAEKERMERRIRNRALGAEELERMSARPRMPEGLIFGPAVQSAAFNPDEETAGRMEELSRKRDRSATPPPPTHYDAAKEIRTKGVGFYSFSRDEGVRRAEMEDLEGQRRETERLRGEREEKKERRRREIEERRRAIGEKRARKMADSFLEGLEADIPATKGRDEEA